MAFTLRSDLVPLIQSNAKRFGVDPYMLMAIIMQESAGRQYACRFEPKWEYFFDVPIFAARNGITPDTERNFQMCSWGPAQVMGAVCRELSFNGPLVAIAGDVFGVEYGARALKRFSDRYPDPLDVFAAYNRGSVKKDPNTGLYVNEKYVRSCKNYLDQFTKNTQLLQTPVHDT